MSKGWTRCEDCGLSMESEEVQAWDGDEALCEVCGVTRSRDAWKKMALLLGYGVEWSKYAYHIEDEIEAAWDRALELDPEDTE
jgi:hypothetical protein